MSLKLNPEHIAVNRFGIGPKAGDLDRAHDIGPQEYVMTQIDNATVNLPEFEESLTEYQSLKEFWDHRMSVYNEWRRLIKEGDDETAEEFEQENRRLQQAGEKFQRGMVDYINHQLDPFVGKIAWHWDNVFASTMAGFAAPGYLMRDAILPHMFGYFGDLLSTATRHPQMYRFLNNDQNTNRGLNENLARENLQLHSIGPGPTTNPHYQQTDIIEHAKALAGLGAARQMLTTKTQGRSIPGPYNIIGKQYNTLDEVHQDLAINPLTARTQCARLLENFLGVYEEEDLQTLVDAWVDTNGHLPSVYYALVNLTDAWSSDVRQTLSVRDNFHKLFRLTGFTRDGVGRHFLRGLGTSFDHDTPFGIFEEPKTRQGSANLIEKDRISHIIRSQAIRKDQDYHIPDFDSKVVSWAIESMSCSGDQELVDILNNSRTSGRFSLLAISPQFNRV